VIRELVTRDDLSAEITSTRWHPVEEAWKDASEPLPATPEAVEEEQERRESAEEQEADRTRSWVSHVRVELPRRHDAVELANTLEGEGHNVHRRWRYVTIDLASEEAAQELADRLSDTLPEGTELTIETKPPDPVFVFLESRGV
jgi:hypothetical protein